MREMLPVIKEKAFQTLRQIGEHIPFKDRIVGGYTALKNAPGNFRKNGDPEQVEYGLFVAGAAYFVVPIQALGAVVITQGIDALHLPPVVTNSVAIGIYALSKIYIAKLNEKMMKDKKYEWCADYHSTAIFFGFPEHPTGAAAAGLGSDVLWGTLVNGSDLAGLYTLAQSNAGNENSSFFAANLISKSIVFPLYYTLANFIIYKGWTEPVLKMAKKTRLKITDKFIPVYRHVKNNPLTMYTGVNMTP